MIIGAGLPKIYKMLSEEKSYSERLFLYKEIGSLTEEQSRKAIEEPAKKFKVSYTDEAVCEIIKIIPINANKFPVKMQQKVNSTTN